MRAAVSQTDKMIGTDKAEEEEEGDKGALAYCHVL